MNLKEETIMFVRKETSSALLEVKGTCGKKVTIDLNHVEYIHEDKMMDKPCTLICFTSGKKLFVDADYALVKDALNDFRTGTDKTN